MRFSTARKSPALEPKWCVTKPRLYPDLSPMATSVVPWMPTVFSSSIAASIMLSEARAERSACVRVAWSEFC